VSDLYSAKVSETS